MKWKIVGPRRAEGRWPGDFLHSALVYETDGAWIWHYRKKSTVLDSGREVSAGAAIRAVKRERMRRFAKN